MLFPVSTMTVTAGIVIINAFLFGNVYSSKCNAFEISKNNLNKALVGHSVLEVNDINHNDCARTCMSMSVCKSIDFDRNEHVCKLNDVDQSSVVVSEFETKGGSIFSDISEWPSAMVGSCSSRPCKANQRCFQKDASHVCKDLTCAFDQRIENGKVQISSPGENKFLDVALVKCDKGYVPIQQEVKCEASGKWQLATCYKLTNDCREILYTFPEAKSGKYKIKLWKSGKILTVNCDMETDGGGWTIFHRRMDGSVEFYRNFTEYENGFGNVEGELWLGLKYIKELAEHSSTEIRIDMTRNDSTTGHEACPDFMLTEGTNYTLTIGPCTRSGMRDARYVFAYNNQMPFSTYDRDLDVEIDCPVDGHGAWWYKNCNNVNLNGLYLTPGKYDTKPYCGHWHYGFNRYWLLKKSSMMIRRK
ncbi:microfibril-associated glycoprotein 4-like [Ruditapes philippinarum]|uniref:microfibril-associated glycoprotein 4-like n=1 Tax=Ruditapes philippinarum TaxID=129788 RepID=UPI00295B5C55|nr:microfibril-associated glycoprotein 4-like [Ruditapes philippinarum]